MAKKLRIVYEDGYDHLSHNRTEFIIVRVNAAEKAAIDDMTAALGVKNQSEFIRNQIFGAYKSMTPEQLRKMAEVAAFRTEEHKISEQFK